MIKRNGPVFNPPHPREFIVATYLEPYNISARTLASALNVEVTSTTRILAGEARVTPATAVRLQAALGRTAESWLAIQEAHDLAKARQEVDANELQSLEALFAVP